MTNEVGGPVQESRFSLLAIFADGDLGLEETTSSRKKTKTYQDKALTGSVLGNSRPWDAVATRIKKDGTSKRRRILLLLSGRGNGM